MAATKLPAGVSDEITSKSLAIHYEDHLLAMESARGYREVLGDVVDANLRGPSIYAGLRKLSDREACDLYDRVWGGQRVVIESGLSFTSESESSRHRDQIRDLFGLQVQKNASDRNNHYIEFSWPIKCNFRHFSEFITIVSSYREQAEEVIARVGNLPAAVRRPIGRGGVVYLGSPLGPILASGDREAKKLTHALVRWITHRGVLA